MGVLDKRLDEIEAEILARFAPPSRNRTNDELRAWADAIEAAIEADQVPEDELEERHEQIAWLRALPLFEHRQAALDQMARGECSHYSPEKWERALLELDRMPSNVA